MKPRNMEIIPYDFWNSSR